jgi:hypothetical protein
MFTQDYSQKKCEIQCGLFSGAAGGGEIRGEPKSTKLTDLMAHLKIENESKWKKYNICIGKSSRYA